MRGLNFYSSGSPLSRVSTLIVGGLLLGCGGESSAPCDEEAAEIYILAICDTVPALTDYVAQVRALGGIAVVGQVGPVEPAPGEVIASEGTRHVARTLESGEIFVTDTLGESVGRTTRLSVTAWSGTIYWSDDSAAPVCYDPSMVPDFGPLPTCFMENHHALSTPGEPRLWLLSPPSDSSAADYHVEWNTPVVGGTASTQDTLDPAGLGWVLLSDLERR